MKEIFNHIQISELVMISTAYGIGQYWHKFRREIDAISNTDFILTRAISKSFSLMLVLDIVIDLVYYCFIIYSWYLTNWKVALTIFIAGFVTAVIFDLIYTSNSKLKTFIETFFIFLFYLQPVLMGVVIWNFIVQNS